MTIPKGGAIAGLRDRALLLTCFAGSLGRPELVTLNREDVRFIPEALMQNPSEQGTGIDLSSAACSADQ